MGALLGDTVATGPAAPSAARTVAGTTNTTVRPASRTVSPRPDARRVVLAVHGGAGSALKRDRTSPERERAYRDGLAGALRAGQHKLRTGGSSVDAVEAAVRVLEDDPLFNAGRGAVFNEDAAHELDASVMRGSDQAAGAVAGVRHVRNPVSAARLVMEKTRHVLLAGEGADDFAARNGLPTVTQDYYWTEARWQELLKAKGRSKRARSASGGEEEPGARGTVGAVAVDGRKDLAAATSTGGLVNKMVGRVGDSPVVGAGTYAKNGTVAASATGAGEVFIRGAATGTISHLIEFGGRDLASAAYEVVVERLPELGGTGGVIALNARGDFDAPHSSEGMLHGYLTADGKIVTKVFYDESLPNR
ncbi:isoaspartyl peptidase/L-asparaginase [Streptomyces sp. MST-110588]|uniref:isoaspartyl peptidase/L-asparaginase family protein n=1 Tax=Streptomyces sp. MST-110588 TaxID=2833628 RepID=UPI001F5DFB59|nr:isoaspartyl peptidase/L-asparaginase [Streptomyces sp. MST-110588]UNO44307.1 isoaspartyl peptidase/L-asparaginase [Streptomyces sp. MST-110588]